MEAVVKALPVGSVLNRTYYITGFLGEGGSGFVYLAQEVENPGAQWAIKEVCHSVPDDEEVKEALIRFRKEYEVLKSLSHTGLPGVHDFFSGDRGDYMVMEYVEGQNIQALMEAGNAPMALDEVLDITLQLLDILKYLHNQDPPVIYRDLKPLNILRTDDGTVKLIDFGIARYFSPEKIVDTEAMGTPGFSAPEQYGKAQSDARSDLYALGATAFFLLTFRYPESFRFCFPPVTQFNPSVPDGLSKVLAQCLAVDPASRFASASELRKLLTEKFSHLMKAVPGQSAPSASQAGQLPGAVASIPLKVSRAQYLNMSVYLACVIALAVLEYMLIEHSLVRIVLLITVIVLIRNCFTSPQDRTFHPVVNVLLIALLVPLFFLGMQRAERVRKANDYPGCSRNLQLIGAVLHQYSVKHNGTLPQKLSDLTPGYIESIPTCPSAGEDTYSDSYKWDNATGNFTVCCKGHHHRSSKLQESFPRYSVIDGLEEYPFQFESSGNREGRLSEEKN